MTLRGCAVLVSTQTLVACADAPERVPWPTFDATVESVVVGASRDERMVAAFATSSDEVTPATFEVADDSVLYALGFRQSLSDLQLTPGALRLDATSGYTLGSHTPVDQLLLSADESRWQAAPDSNPLSLQHHPFTPMTRPCGIRLEDLRIIRLDGRPGKGTLLVLDDHHVLATSAADGSADSNRLWLINKNGSHEIQDTPNPGRVVLTTPSGLDDAEPKYVAIGSQLYVLEWDGRQMSLRLEKETLSTPAKLYEMLTVRDRLFGVTDDAELFELVEGTWTLWHAFNQGGPADMSMVAKPDGSIAVASSRSLELLYLEGGEKSVVDPGIGAAPSSLGYREDLGILIGDGFGHLWKEAGSTFERMPETGLSLGINAIVSTERGLVFCGSEGYVGQYVDGTFCPPLRPGVHGYFSLRVWGDDLVGRNRSAEPGDLFELVLLPRAPQD